MIAKFKIKQIITVKGKAYVLAISINDKGNWYLSETSYLGQYSIENWLDIPRSLDENENVVAFALRNEKDKDKLKENDVVELWDDYVDIIDSYKLSLPKIVGFIKCYPGELPVGTIVSNDKNQKWMLQNFFHTNSVEGYELIEEMKKQNIFEYALKPIDHNEKPTKGEKLRVERTTI
jgi:hypothetical protein